MRLLHLYRPHLPLRARQGASLSPSRPVRSSRAAGPEDPGPVMDADPEARTLGPDGGCRSGALIGSFLKRPSSTRTPVRIGQLPRPPSRRSPRSARGSPAAPSGRPSACSRSGGWPSSRCGAPSRSSLTGWSRRSSIRLAAARFVRASRMVPVASGPGSPGPASRPRSPRSTLGRGPPSSSRPMERLPSSPRIHQSC